MLSVRGFIPTVWKIEEIGLELKETWLKAGGKVFHYIPCLNDSEASVSLVEKIVEEELLHWPE